MKWAFLIVSLVCGFAVSMLMVQTARLAALQSEASAEPKDEAKLAGEPMKLDERVGLVDSLVTSLENRKESLAAKEEELEIREEALRLGRNALNRLLENIQQSEQRLSDRVVEMEDAERTNFRKLAEVCGKMEAESAATLLREMEPDRAARILSMMPDRSAAAVLDAAIAGEAKGVTVAAEWADAIRRMMRGERKQNPGEG